MESVIQGDKFKTLGEFTYSPKNRSQDDYDKLPNTIDLIKLKNVNRVYTHTMYAKQLFDDIQGFNKKFIVITHNSDANVDFAPPDNVIKWYSQNVNIQHERIMSIPIGLENDRWFPHLHKKGKMSLKLKQPREYRNLLYVNHNISTNIAERLKPYQIFEGQPWATTERGVNGNKFDEYLDNIYNHKFIVCPRGNGLDTHRLWEALYMGSIPIVKIDINNSFYDDLPILYVNDWEEVTENLLIRIFMLFKTEQWNLNKLNFSYWRDKILSNG